jgi:hypothetical protein
MSGMPPRKKGRRSMATSASSSSGNPFGAALRSAIRCRGLTLDRIRWHLARRGVPIGLSSLSDWQHGRSVPAAAKSLQAVRALEDILELPADALAHLISVSRRASTADERLDESGSPVGPLLSSVADTSGEFDMLVRGCHVTVDGNGRAAVMRDRIVLRAHHDGLDRYVLRYLGDPGCDIEAVRFGRLRNCQVGRVVRRPDPKEPALVAELIFDQPLRSGETWVFDTELLDDTGGPCSDYGHGFRQPVNQFVLELKFSNSVDPVRPYSFAEEGLGTGPQHLQDLKLNADRTVHFVASDVRSGVLGVAWS